MVKYCIYYDDGTVHTGKGINGVAEARVTGVQFIAQEDPDHVWVALSGTDYFIWDTRDGITKWYCADNAGRENYMREPGWKKVLIGSWIGDETFREISRRVSADLQVGKKTGYAWWEKMVYA